MGATISNAGASSNRYFYSFGKEGHPPRGHYGWRGALVPGVFVGVPLGQKLELEWQFLYGQYQGSYTKRHTNGVYGDQPFRFRFSYLNAPLLLRYYVWDHVYLSAGFNPNVRLAHCGTQTFMGRTEPFEAYPTVMSLGAWSERG
ncbi:MAG: outer membrane beta-barrel protein [Cytophagales bacterium]|nr:outer membrane beta-barrel protein [Cytophagales bacterium]